MVATTAKTSATIGCPRSHQANAAAAITIISMMPLPNGSTRSTALGDRNNAQRRIARTGARIPITIFHGKGHAMNPQIPRLTMAKSSRTNLKTSLKPTEISEFVSVTLQLYRRGLQCLPRWDNGSLTEDDGSGPIEQYSTFRKPFHRLSERSTLFEVGS